MASSHLPQEVVEDILSRLPVKSLKRFKCLNKSWCALIQSPTFIAQHLHHSSQSNNACLLVKHQDNTTKKNMLSLIPNDYDHRHGELDMSVNLGLPFFNEDTQSLKVKGACINGIVCLYGGAQFGNKDIVLWNPAMREFKVVPACPIDCPPYADYSVEGLGFGYDAKTKDYKVVRTVYIWEVNGPLYPHLIEVFSLNTNAWRKIDTV